MADDDKIQLQADLGQPADQLDALRKKVETVLTATTALQAQFNALADSKIGVVTTKQLDTVARELMRAMQTTMTLVKNENLGARLATEVARNFAAGMKANQITLSRSVTDAMTGVFKDAEKLVAGSRIAELLANKNAGTSQLVGQTRADLAARQTISPERQLELIERQRAAELLLAQARAESLLQGEGASKKMIARREQELAAIQNVRREIQAQTKELNDQVRAEERAAAAADRRATALAQASIRPAARLSVLDTINQTTGVDKHPDDERALSLERARYANLAEKRADIIAAMDTVAKAKADAQIARQDAARAQRQGADPGRVAALQREADQAQAAYQTTLANAQKDLQRLRLFGDGGQFLIEIQARLLLNYKILNGFFQAIGYGVSSVVEFDDALHKLQAISGATKGEMAQLHDVITGVAEGSRFSATEITKAATALAQAGLSSQQIQSALEPITKLATSTGSELKTAVDVVTSVLGAFNYRAEETGNVVNIMAGALNSSKLDMEKLALGIQYSGNSAAQANVSFSELTTVISALSNTGVKSGSTLGTGVTQIIADLLNPTEKLKEALKSTGLTLADVDVRTRGLIPVLKSMADAGFGASQAFEGFELRGARAYLGLLGQVDKLQDMQKQMLLSNAAIDGNRAAMDSMQASIDRLKANYGVLADAIGGPFVKQVAIAAGGIADLIRWFREWGVSLGQVITAIAGGAAFALLGSYLTNIGVALYNIVRASVTVVTALVTTRLATLGFAAAADTAAVATSRLSAALALLGRVGIPLAIFAAFEIFSLLVGKTSSDLDRFNEKMDKTRQAQNEATQAVQKQVETQEALDKAINDLVARYGTLSRDSAALQTTTLELRTRFADLGLELPKTVTRVDQLVDALNKLRRISQDQEILDLTKKLSANEDQARQATTEFQRRSQRAELNEFLLNNTGGRIRRVIRGDYRGREADGSRRGAAFEADTNLKNTVGLADGINKAIEQIQSNSVEAVVEAKASLTRILDELNKRKRNGDTKMKPGEVVGVDDNIDLVKALLEYAGTSAEIGLQGQRASAGAESDKATLALKEQLRKPIFATLDAMVQGASKEIQGLRDELAKTPTDKRREVLDRMKARTEQMQRDIDGRFNAYLDTLSDDAKLIAREAFNTRTGRAVKSESARVDTDTKNALTDINKYETAGMEVEKRTIQRQIENVQARLKISSEFETVNQANTELVELERRLADVTNRLAEKQRINLRAKENTGELEIFNQKVEEEIDAIRQQGAERRIANSQKTVTLEKARLDAEASSVERMINATIQAQLSSMQGMLGKGMSVEQKERILSQIQELMEQLISIQIRSFIRSIEVAGGNPDDPQYRAQADAIIATLRERMKTTANGIRNNEMRAGQDALSREMKQMLTDITVSLQKLAQNFKEIERGLSNAVRAADNIQARFNYSQAAYDSPQNRGRFSSGARQVTEFEQSFDVQNRVRQLKIESETNAANGYQKLVSAAKERVDFLEAEKAKLEKVAAGNNVNNAALAAVKESLTKAEGEYTKYQQALERARIELERLSIEQEELNKEKPTPGVFETMETGVKQWLFQNGLFRDSMAQIGEQVPNMLNAVSSNMAGFFNDITIGTKSVGQAFGDMARNIIKSLIQILNQMLAMQMLKSLFSVFGINLGGGATGGGSGGGGITTSVLPDITPRAGGGYVYNMADGGYSPNRDSVNTRLMPGEFVLRRAAVQSVGREALDDINAMGNRAISLPEPSEKSGAAGNQQVVNVWVVPPGQQPPPPSEKDIIAVITKDMMNSGATRQMIKSIQNGAV